jgi:hypothetical protein
MPEKKTLFMETTAIDSDKTAAEITSLLVKSGARQLSMQYDEKQKLTGVTFILLTAYGPVSFALPVRVEPIFNILNGRRKYSYDRSNMAEKDRAQAERVAWRQLLRWVQAQLAMIDCGMVKGEEVFLPYLVHAGSGQTLFEYFQKDGLKQLTSGGPK